jgi:hypothetical protein
MKILRYDDKEFGDLYANVTTNYTPPYIENKANWGTN